MATTLAQQRAEFCLQRLKTIPCRSDFKNFSSGLPAMILQNGFGQTLAFLVAKGSKENKRGEKIEFSENDKHYIAFCIITEWLKKRKLLVRNTPLDMLLEISEMDQCRYLQAQRETLAMLEWLKRYANAALFDGED